MRPSMPSQGWPKQWWMGLVGLWLISILAQSNARPFLMFATVNDIRFVQISPESRHPLKSTIAVKKLNDVQGLDFFLHKNKVCWIELNEPVIKCAEMSVSGKVKPEIIVNSGLVRPEGLACDWLNDNIYWTDSYTKRIEVASIHSKVRNVIISEDIDMPRAIAVAPEDGYLFWSDWGEQYPKIERVSMDGDNTSRRIIVDQEIAWPNGLTLDLDSKMLYWIDAKLNYIARVDWNGNNRENLYHTRSPDSMKLPVAISVYQKELYWTDYHLTNSVHLLNLTNEEENGQRTVNKIKLKKEKRGLTLKDIKVFEPMRQKSVESPCQFNNGDCSHLCLAADNAQGYSCSCPRGIRLVDKFNCADGHQEILVLALRNGIRKISLDTPDFSDIIVPIHQDKQEDAKKTNIVAVDYDPLENKIYWTATNNNGHLPGISSVYPNGTGRQLIIDQDIDHPDGLAIDYLGRNLFFTDTTTDRIEVSKLDGTNRKVLISHGLDEPRDITLDLVFGYMYWSDWGVDAKIERAWLDGSHRTTIITENITWPNGIALDVTEQRIYWCDAKWNQIESANVDGTDRKILINELLAHPFGLTILGDYFYWTDWEDLLLERAEKYTGQDRRVLAAHLQDLMSVKATETQIQPIQVSQEACLRSCMELENFGVCPCAEENSQNLCENNGGCSHLCLVTPMGKQCSCPNGQEIGPDQYTCHVPEAYMLFTSFGSINRASIDNDLGHNIFFHHVTNVADFVVNPESIFWIDAEEKIINRADLNGTITETKKVLVEFGVGVLENLAVDYIGENVYWTDTELNRIEVVRFDGNFRRVLLWKDLQEPTSLTLNPNQGKMYWSSRIKSVIEVANLDGTKRRIFVPNAGLATDLTIDLTTHRLYWIDSKTSKISYATMDAEGFTKTIIDSGNPNAGITLQGLTIYKDHIYWYDSSQHVIEKANKANGLERSIVLSNVQNVTNLMVIHDDPKENEVSNPCQIDNGGCPELCLFNGKQATCKCSSHHDLQDGGSQCLPPTEFLLFGQKNKMSRLLTNAQDDVPDLVLPIQGARDIRSLSYDSLTKTIYWIDYGSNRSQKISINFAYDNGTTVKRNRILAVEENEGQPYAIVIDDFHRLLFWNDEKTNVINILNLDDEHYNNIGQLLTSDQDTPRALAIHTPKSRIFWVNSNGPKIESSQMDGNSRKILIESDLQIPTDLCVDAKDDLIFWTDIGSHRLERSDLDGSSRQVLVSNGIKEPLTLITVQDDYVYWAVRKTAIISRVNKFNGDNIEVIKSNVHHLSSLVSVQVLKSTPNPCSALECSHMCLLDDKGEPYCTCPVDSNLVIQEDSVTCGEPPKCNEDQFTCDKNARPLKCIPMNWRCDGIVECKKTKADEIGCNQCDSHGFRCLNSLNTLNVQCVNTSQICDGVNDCSDFSDEQDCCLKGFFECTVTKKCIEEGKKCDGVIDCEDSSDESSLTCESLEYPLVQDSKNWGIGFGVFFAIGIIGCTLGLIYYMRKRQRNQKQQNSSPHLRYPGEGSDNQAVNNNQAQPLATSARHVQQQPYNRSVLTGASSSTGSSRGRQTMWKDTMPMPNPPPSPITAVEFRQARTHSSHAPPSHYTRSLPRERRQTHFARAHPNTPAQTEVSESESGLYRGQYYTYESDYYGGEATAHPPTPRSQYEEYATHHSGHHHHPPRSQYDDYGTHPGHANSYCSEPPEEERTFIPQERAFMPPPPSRCDSPT